MKLLKKILPATLSFSLIFSSATYISKNVLAESNEIQSISVDSYSVEEARQNLEELCAKFGVVGGIQTEDSIGLDWQLSSWQYFFSPGRDMYSKLGDNSKVLLRKCVKFMYDNRDNVGFKDSIYTALVGLSCHGGHCYARAESIVESVYVYLSELE